MKHGAADAEAEAEDEHAAQLDADETEEFHEEMPEQSKEKGFCSTLIVQWTLLAT